jgi:hypothetical protein
LAEEWKATICFHCISRGELNPVGLIELPNANKSLMLGIDGFAVKHTQKCTQQTFSFNIRKSRLCGARELVFESCLIFSALEWL